MTLQKCEWSSLQFRRTAVIALVVGTTLSLVNDGGEIFSWVITFGTLVKIIFNFLTPMIVANLGWVFSQKRNKS
ncbi:hypothetical protein HFU84_05105 [Acidithiobacillus sp. CV18-2]|uniref:hypothetical protein n=1 Tax=Acidithiobacillus caldus TaxID=33059 RepID=UPI001AA47EFD|nr:hypothetical protein [Acidithiobacillus caldus]MBN6741766.1 hypothetical protein [Acidithiobacillus sp. MC6.1]MBU2753900.1 hypothetical protein [Acidithiobacillus sp. CV18-3]MBU2758567.1 hypothetical protein [Acidithiobacillus sp. BN09-2]MBU2776894.1 hypothetical protein [Acidithiobacillus sp. CV18-2]MBU2800052.1 hypothetical protein [Acidithiobacillus sp. VAN18-4]